MARNETITRDSIFGHVMGKAENCLYLLQQILPELGLTEVTVVPQKEVNKSLREKNIRFDIWAKTRDGRQFDIEMQMTNSPFIGQRFRYYQSEADKNTLPKGKSYSQIKSSYIIFFSPFDPFALGKAKYEIAFLADKNHPETEINTGAHWLYFNSVGHRENLSEDLNNFLDYMNGKVNKDSKFIQKIDSEVKNYIASPEWRKIDMNLDMMLADKEYEVQVEDIKKTIRIMNDLNTPGSQILNSLLSEYGNYFSKEQLQKIMDEVK